MNIDFKFVIFYCFVFGLIESINNYIHKKIQEREGKKAEYDCSKCKAWDCPAKKCKGKRINQLMNDYDKM